MISKTKIGIFYGLSLLFILINCYLVVNRGILFFNFAPLAFILFFALFYSFEKTLLLSVFFVPLSVPLKNYLPIDFNLDIPTEPIFICILFIFVLVQLKDRNFSSKIILHPVSLSIIFYLLWRLITTLTSSMPLVSFKYWMMLLWLIIPFYFVIIPIFKNKNNINKFFWFYIISFCIVITYVLIKHSFSGFSQTTSNYVAKPFFNDHTSYGAALAMYIPILIGFIFNKEFSKKMRTVSLIVLGYFIIAIIFSYTRAAWVSLIGALAIFIVLKLKINYKIIVSIVIVAVGAFFLFQDQIFFALENNKQDSSTNFGEHVKSITNVATDASNLERINRWNCAIRMYHDKPVFGWGPGTYQFQYAPYQYSYEKTIISTNSGNLGNAHSEYLGTLSESGLIGMMSFIIVLILIFTTAIKSYNRTQSGSIRILITSTLCGLITYFIHGFLNNFLDIDKIAIPFWGFAAVIVAIDLYLTNQEKNIKSPDNSFQINQ